VTNVVSQSQHPDAAELGVGVTGQSPDHRGVADGNEGLRIAGGLPPKCVERSVAYGRQRFPETSLSGRPFALAFFEVIAESLYVAQSPPGQRGVRQPFPEVELDGRQRELGLRSDETRRLQRPSHRRSHDAPGPHLPQLAPNGLGLLDPLDRERRPVPGRPPPPFRVDLPRPRLAMTNKNDASHARIDIAQRGLARAKTSCVSPPRRVQVLRRR
jgi:hypothetical protein